MKENVKEIVIATNNQNKAREIQGILGDSWKVKTLKDFPGYIEPEETGVTFEENAEIKAKTAAEKLGIFALADDSGLEVDHLNGAPGVYSARYAGLEKDDLQNNLKLLREMEGVPQEERKARFVCSICVAEPNGNVHTVRGICEGEIGFEMRGENGFGYDVLFYLPEYDQYSAELSFEEKNKISHRFKAIEKILPYLNQLK